MSSPTVPKATIRWRANRVEGPRRLRRVAEILADILDNHTSSEDATAARVGTTPSRKGAKQP